MTPTPNSTTTHERLIMHIDIDEARCSGCGQCVMEAPDLFDQREDDGVAMLLRNPMNDEERAAAITARAACPADAIVLLDD